MWKLLPPLCLIGLMLSPVAPAPAQEFDPDQWTLAFEDKFEREEPGPLYEKGDRAKSVSIEDGRLLIVGSGASAMIGKSFTTDVRLEFDCQAWPERDPVDLSAKISEVYLFGFGARSNLANHLLGPGMNVVDLDPEMLIEKGRTYHMVAQREGRRMFYQVDGEIILDGTSENLVGGQEFDRVGFITWSGMYVDNVKVYERKTPHPDTRKYITSVPGLPLEREGRKVMYVEGTATGTLKNALDALNAGQYEKAIQRFMELDNVTLKMAGLAHVYGDVNYVEKPSYGKRGDFRDFGDLGAFADLWRQAAEANPDNVLLKAYLPAAEAFGRLHMSRSGHNDATMLLSLGEKGNPFYHKAKLYKARYIFWDGMEGASGERKNQAHDMMRELHTIWPDNRVLNEYVGEPVPWGEELNADTENHPAWAAYLREAYAREVAIMERFVDARQAPNGEFGGGWGDDVEMMRKWVPIAAISTCAEKVRRGIDNLTEGIHQYMAPRGYSEGIADVEHSAEPTADVYPTMLVLRHGDPRYYEMNLQTCKIIKDVMMGIDANGYPRAKAVEIGARGANTKQMSGGGDTGYHARAMKHFYYAAWYGNDEALDWYVRWAKGWGHTILIDEPNKPAGVAPGTIWYPSGSYYPPNGELWFSDKAENYYGVMGLPIMIHQSLLAAYMLAPDRELLHPVQRMLDLATSGPLYVDGHEPPSREWALASLAHQASSNVTSLYRTLTGERVYDEYTRRFGTPPQQYQISQDLSAYLDSFETAAKSLRHNLWYYTTEVLSTDRLHLPSVEAVWGAYSGAVSTFVDAEAPTMGVTYETPDANFAAIVTENSETRLRLWIYTFWDEPQEITLNLWRLTPGDYLVTQGELMDGERPFQHRYDWSDPALVRILHRAEPVSIVVPPKKTWVVDFRLHRVADVPRYACDLAIHTRDLAVDGENVLVTIHNIGNAPAEHFSVATQVLEKDGWVTADEVLVDRLSHPTEYIPFTAEVELKRPAGVPDDRWRVVLDPADDLYEITEMNNVASPGQ